jgi:hypothetical protein
VFIILIRATAIFITSSMDEVVLANERAAVRDIAELRRSEDNTTFDIGASSNVYEKSFEISSVNGVLARV